MVVGKVTVTNPTGIHARTATNLSSVCMNCESRVELRIGQNIIDPKNMLGLLEKQIKCGTELEQNVEFCTACGSYAGGKTETVQAQPVAEPFVPKKYNLIYCSLLNSKSLVFV